MKYLKNSVLQHRHGQDAQQVQALLEHVLGHEANVRVHGTTRRVPRELLAHERVAFRPLPGVRYEPISLPTIFSLNFAEYLTIPCLARPRGSNHQPRQQLS